MSHFNGLGALKAVLIKGTNYRKIDNTLYRYSYACTFGNTPYVSVNPRVLEAFSPSLEINLALCLLQELSTLAPLFDIDWWGVVGVPGESAWNCSISSWKIAILLIVLSNFDVFVPPLSVLYREVNSLTTEKHTTNLIFVCKFSKKF